MVSTKQRLLDEALNLSEEDRAELANAILQSVGRTQDETAFFTELDRRRRQVESGEVDMIPWEDVRRRWEGHLDEKSASTSKGG